MKKTLRSKDIKFGEIEPKMFGMNQAQSSFLELVKCAIKSDAAYTNISDEIAQQCANTQTPL